MGNVVSAEHVSKTYGVGSARHTAVDGVSLEVPEGQFLLVRGQSGSGKTTLLHCLSTIARPDTGRVVLDGQDAAGLDDRGRAALRARAMGFVFQRFNLLPALTVAENVRLPLEAQRLDREFVARRTTEALSRVALAERAGAYPHELSGGQLQLAALARAVAAGPRMVWADEPTGALDAAGAERVLLALRRIVDDGATLLLVSHDPGVEPYADRVVTLHDGRLAA